jgi:integrase
VKGNITRRGKASWRLKFDDAPDPVTGKRRTRYVTIKGKRQDAQRRLTEMLAAQYGGILVDPSEMTVATYIRGWLASPAGLAPRTVERYRQLAEWQIIPFLGAVPLQRLKPTHLMEWYDKLRVSGGRGGKPLAPQTILQAHRLLYSALERATKAEIIGRNVAHAVKPPTAERDEVATLRADQVEPLLEALHGSPFETLATVALFTGARRGELLAVRWGDIDLAGATMRIERSLEQTKAGLRFKGPKTKNGRRTITLPATALEALQAHRVRQLELRLSLGQGKPDADTLVFSTADGAPLPPNRLSFDWARFVRSRGLPQVRFHALRHTHASALIAERLDTLTISRRLGHSSPLITLRVYGHLFHQTDAAAAEAVERALRGGERA